MGVEIRRIEPYLWEIPRSGKMRVPGRVYASDHLMEDIRGDESLVQVQNVATLPGIVGWALAGDRDPRAAADDQGRAVRV